MACVAGGLLMFLSKLIFDASDKFMEDKPDWVSPLTIIGVVIIIGALTYFLVMGSHLLR